MTLEYTKGNQKITDRNAITTPVSTMARGRRAIG